MLLQTNSYIVPKDKRIEHARLVQRFKHAMAQLGCDQFEVYERSGPNWNAADADGRFIQIMRFRDRKHQHQVQQAEKHDPDAQQLIKEFCELINFPYQQQQGLFAIGFYTSVLQGESQRIAGGVQPVPSFPAEPAEPARPAEPPELPAPQQSIEQAAPQQPEPEADTSEFPDAIDEELDLAGLEPIANDDGEPPAELDLPDPTDKRSTSDEVAQ